MFLEGNMIESFSGKGKKKIEFDFWDGDILMFREVGNGIILFSDFQYNCETSITNNEGK